jgi:disulfide oxidoreductase YuzD
MNVIKISTTNGSFCSTDINTISKRIKEQLQNTIKSKLEEKFVVEVFDISNNKLNLSSQLMKDNLNSHL